MSTPRDRSALGGRASLLGALAAGVLTLGSLTALSAPPAAAGDLCHLTPDTSRGVNVLTAPVRFVNVPGARLGYRAAGRGTPIVLIPGSSNTMAEWDSRLLNRLATKHRVIIFDNRGTGTSTGKVDHLTVALMSRDTSALIAQVAGGRADVLGWSMGGYVAQQLAIDFPGRVSRLVLASTNPGSPSTSPPTPAALKVLTNPNATQAQRMSILFPPNQQAAAARWTANIGASFAANHYQPYNSFTIPPATATAQVTAAGTLWLGPGKGVLNKLNRIHQPVLIAAGRLDIVSPIANAGLLAGRLPQAKSVIYTDAGHAFLFQYPDGFGKRVNAFLSGC